MRSPARFIAAMCAVHVLGMLGFATFPALLPTFIESWQLSNTEAGWMNSVFFAGYMVSVPVLVTLTDRIDPRRIYLVFMLLNEAALLAFPLLAEGFWSGMALRTLAGIGMAGTYMPGLKVLTDWVSGPAQSRAVAFYTSSFGVGTASSYYLAGRIGESFGWQWAFLIAAGGSFVALIVAAWVLPPKAAVPTEAPPANVFNFMPVLRNRTAMGYSLAYAFHNFELFGFRSWVVVYLTFSLTLQPEGSGILAPATLAALFTLLGLPASVTGNELAVRFGRKRVVITVMLLSALTAWAFGWSAALPYWSVVALGTLYGILITMDSSPITAGTVAEALPGMRGATMAVHSTVGFLGSFLGPLVFGVVLDLSGRASSQMSWGLAFGTMGVAVAMGPLCMALLNRKPTDTPQPAGA